MTAPLDGIVVADLSRVLAGPLAAATLADLGATVIKVERPGSGDDTRQWGPPWTATSSSYFESANRSKQSIELDLADPEDRRVAIELTSRADVVIENFRAGALGRHGLAYDQVAERNPSVVYASISGFGSAGGRDLLGYDFLVQAVGGLMSVTGQRGEPSKVGVALVDVLTAKDATIGILAALRERETSGLGQHIEVNLLSSLLGSLVNQASGFLATGRSPVAMGNQHPSIAPYETLATADGLVAVCCGNDDQFRRLTEVLGLGDLAEDPRFATNPSRVENRDVLVEALEGALSTTPAREWIQELSQAGIPAGSVGSIADAFSLAETLGLQPTVDVGADAPAQVRNPVTFSRTPINRYTAPPRLGEHNIDVRRWLTQGEAP